LHLHSCTGFLCFDSFFSIFFFNLTAHTQIYTLSLHDALPIYSSPRSRSAPATRTIARASPAVAPAGPARRSARAWRRVGSAATRSEEHTSELQSRGHLVCRLLLEKKKTT